MLRGFKILAPIHPLCSFSKMIPVTDGHINVPFGIYPNVYMVLLMSFIDEENHMALYVSVTSFLIEKPVIIAALLYSNMTIKQSLMSRLPFRNIILSNLSSYYY